MRPLTLLLLVYLTAIPALAQEEETLISGKIAHGGFGGPVVKFTEVKDKFGVLVGGRGGWIINHTFVIGGGGYGLVNDIKANVRGTFGEMLYLTMGYGGLELEYINASNKLLHFSVQTLIGAGGVDYRGRYFSIDFDEDSDEEAFFVAEPGLNLILNVTSFFRIGCGASYRFVSGVDLRGLKDDDLSGPSALLMFKFGKF